MAKEKRPLASFKAWLDGPDPGPIEEPVYFSAWRDRQGLQQQEIRFVFERFAADIQAEFVEGHLLRRIFDVDGPVTLDGGNRNSTTFAYLHIYNNNAGIKLTSLRIRSLAPRSTNTVALTNCWIDVLSLADVARVRIKDCWIGTLECANGIRDISIERGGVLFIKCSPAQGESPFGGSVVFQNVYLPRAPGSRFSDAQPYRNMRAHMLKLQNAPMVALFHSLEQAVERKTDPNSFNKFVSWLYEVLSDYGSSMLRPIGWFLGLNILTFAGLAILNLAAPGNAPLATRLALEHTGHWFAVERAALLTLQGTFNPLGVFSQATAVVPANGLAVAWMLVHSICSTLLVALFIFSLRRRFKMS